jgi:hypothetical protein
MQVTPEARRKAAALLPLLAFGALGFPALLVASNIPIAEAPRLGAGLFGALTVLGPSLFLLPLTSPELRSTGKRIFLGIAGGVSTFPSAVLVAVLHVVVPVWKFTTDQVVFDILVFAVVASLAVAATAYGLSKKAKFAARPGTEVASSLDRRLASRLTVGFGLLMLLGFLTRNPYPRFVLVLGGAGFLIFMLLSVAAVALVVRDAWAIWVVRHPGRYATPRPSAAGSDGTWTLAFDFGVGSQTTEGRVDAAAQSTATSKLVLRGDRDVAVPLVTTGLVWSMMALLSVAVTMGLVLTAAKY